MVREELNKMECPVCHQQVDYLLGEIKQGCEGCFDPAKDLPDKKPGTYKGTDVDTI